MFSSFDTHRSLQHCLTVQLRLEAISEMVLKSGRVAMALLHNMCSSFGHFHCFYFHVLCSAEITCFLVRIIQAVVTH